MIFTETENIEADITAINKISIIPSLLDVICKTTNMGFAAVARVTNDKWVACALHDAISFGLQPGEELKLETTICNEIRQHHQPVVIDHVEKDAIFSKHHTPSMYGFQSYISVPIFLKNGNFFGTLCAIDPRPAKLNTPETIGMFNLFAELISFHLNAVEELAYKEAEILEQQKISELREQFIAILGHDLRNPLGAVLMGAELLLDTTDDEVKNIATLIKSSSFRMSGLIVNILDFARGRLGAGIILDYSNDESLTTILNQVVAEIRTVYRQVIIKTDFHFEENIDCDKNRIAQLFSNLLGNAVTYGAEDKLIQVTAYSDKDYFILSVTNFGNKIPDDFLIRLFQPFYRGDKPGKEGLGLGLYICSEIAKAHGGEIKVSSTEENTCFTLQIPSKNPGNI